jgi:hypothetical protein
MSNPHPLPTAPCSQRSVELRALARRAILRVFGLLLMLLAALRSPCGPRRKAGGNTALLPATPALPTGSADKRALEGEGDFQHRARGAAAPCAASLGTAPSGRSNAPGAIRACATAPRRRASRAAARFLDRMPKPATGATSSGGHLVPKHRRGAARCRHIHRAAVPKHRLSAAQCRYASLSTPIPIYRLFRYIGPDWHSAASGQPFRYIGTARPNATSVRSAPRRGRRTAGPP